MKERPILFSGPMVRAILAGKKTQTRRVCQVQPFQDDDGLWHCYYPWGEGGHGIYETEAEMRAEYDRLILAHCPYGKAGDRLWVRETWRTHERPGDGVDGVLFAADGAFVPIENTQEAAEQWVVAHDNGRHCDRWRPSIHMPRFAARLVLPVVAVRLERLQDISEADAIAEGVHAWMEANEAAAAKPYYTNNGRKLAAYPVTAFSRLWDSINGEPRKRTDGSQGPDISWKANPWVFVVTFEVPR